MYLSYFVAHFQIGNIIKWISGMWFQPYQSSKSYEKEIKKIVLNEFPTAIDINIEIYYASKELVLSIKENAWQL